jgi:hypothetical protein
MTRTDCGFFTAAAQRRGLCPAQQLLTLRLWLRRNLPLFLLFLLLLVLLCYFTIPRQDIPCESWSPSTRDTPTCSPPPGTYGASHPTPTETHLPSLTQPPCTTLPPGQSSIDIQTLWNSFEDKSSTAGKLGGLLCHNFGVDALEEWNRTTPFSLNANDTPIVDCSSKTRGTCSAWAYIRADLMPIVFNAPAINLTNEYATPIVGVIADPNKLFPLITTMGIVDGDTNMRNCCSNQSDAHKYIEFVDSFGAISGWNIPISTEDNPGGGNCDLQCEPQNTHCKSVNGGSSVDAGALSKLFTHEGDVLGSWGCEHCKARNDEPATDCAICTYTNVCYMKKAQPKGKMWAEYVIDAAKKQAINYVNEDVSAFKKLIGESGALRNLYIVGMAQCKFTKDEWASWILGVKLLYQAWIGAYAPDGMGINMLDKGGDYGINYPLATPNWYFGYLENEVNLYIHPKVSEDAPDRKMLSEWQERDNKIFRDAIVAFFYVDKTCLESMRELDGVSSTFRGLTWSHRKNRCYGYLCNNDISPPLKYDESDCYKANVENERTNYIEEGKNQVRRITKNFNEAYRSRSGDAQVLPCRFVGDSNVYLSYKSLGKWQSTGFSGPDVLLPIPPDVGGPVSSSQDSENRTKVDRNSGVGWREAKERKLVHAWKED